MLALSATPGTDLQAVRAMLQNLKISKIELRNEESPDIVKYTHARTIEKVVVGLGEELKSVKEKYLAVLEHFVKRLSQCGVLGKSKTYREGPKDELHELALWGIASQDAGSRNPGPTCTVRIGWYAAIWERIKFHGNLNQTCRASINGPPCRLKTFLLLYPPPSSVRTSYMEAHLASFDDGFNSTFSEQERQRGQPDELHQVRYAEDARGVPAQPAHQPLQDAEGLLRGGLCRLHLALPRLRVAAAARHESLLQLHL